MSGNIIEAVIGGVVLVIASFFVFFAYTTSGEKIDNGYTLTARFDDVSGITPGSDIKMNGIKIGIVKSLVIDKDYLASSQMLIKREIKIPSDSTFAITTDGIIGSKFIAVDPGTSEAYFKDMDEVGNTRSSINLEGLLNKFLFSTKKD